MKCPKCNHTWGVQQRVRKHTLIGLTRIKTLSALDGIDVWELRKDEQLLMAHSGHPDINSLYHRDKDHYRAWVTSLVARLVKAKVIKRLKNKYLPDSNYDKVFLAQLKQAL